jgi:hypothetical protein
MIGLIQESSTPIWFGSGLTLIPVLSLITVLQGWLAIWRCLTESLGWLGVILVGAAFPTTFMVIWQQLADKAAQNPQGQQLADKATQDQLTFILFVVVILFTSGALFSVQARAYPHPPAEVSAGDHAPLPGGPDDRRCGGALWA